MTKYDSILVRTKLPIECDYLMDDLGDKVSLKEVFNVVVLTIEELKEAWTMAKFHQRQGNSGFTFDDYLACKGITPDPSHH